MCKKVFFTFGRMNPPTLGHISMIEGMRGIAEQEGGDLCVILSNTQDHKDNPLSFSDRKEILTSCVPGLDVRCIPDGMQNSALGAIKFMASEYDELYIMCGSDRLPGFERLCKYNGSEFNCKRILALSLWKRDNSNSVSGISSSMLRRFADRGDFRSFEMWFPKNKLLAIKTFHSIQQSREVIKNEYSNNTASLAT